MNGIKNKTLVVFIVIFVTILIFNAYLGISSLQKAKDAVRIVGKDVLLAQNKVYYKNHIDTQNEMLSLLIKLL